MFIVQAFHGREISPSPEQNLRKRISFNKGGAKMSNFVVLVVEDDAFHRELIADLFKDRGLEVVETSTAEAAELILSTAGTELKALVADIKLAGGMSGVQLAEYARGLFPHLKVVLISGNAPPYIPEATRFLLKPYTSQALLEAALV